MERLFESFVFSVSRIYKDIQKIESREMARMGLRGAHALYLYRLSRSPDGLTGAQLAALCDEDKAAVSRAMAQLEQAGLVVYPDDDDQRRYRSRAVLTDAGQEAARRVEELIAEYVGAVQAQMSDARRRSFYSALSEIADNLHKLTDENAEGDRMK